MDAKIQCLGQTTVCIEFEKNRMYFDPVGISDRTLKKATHIFLSGKYADVDSIKKITTKKTKVYCPQMLAEAVSEFNPTVVVPKQVFENVEVIPAYKADKIVMLDRPLYNGYLISGKDSFYFAGPTDLIPEMNIIDVSVAFLPVEGDTMDVFEAVAATNVIHAELFVPIAYAENVEDGLRSCMRFTLKSLQSAELFRKASDIVKPNNNI